MTPQEFAALTLTQAVEYMASRGVTLPGDYYLRAGVYRMLAFTIAGIAALDVLQDVLDSLTDALATGETFQDWRKRAVVSAAVGVMPRHRQETVFRTNVQGAYQRGTYQRQAEIVDRRPYLMYDAINDARTRPAHRAMDGYIARHDDPIWKKWRAPAGFNCVLPSTHIASTARLGLKAFYAGQVVEMRTRLGATLAITPNHPVLTRHGWVAAHAIRKGDELVSNAALIDVAALRKPDDKQSPPRADQLFDALSTQGLARARTAPLDLHGDAQFGDGEVKIAAADGILRMRAEAGGLRGFKKQALAFAVHGAGASSAQDSASDASSMQAGAEVSADRSDALLDVATRDADVVRRAGDADRGGDRDDVGVVLALQPSGTRPHPRRGALPADCLRVVLHGGPLQALGFAGAAAIDAGSAQSIRDYITRNTELLCNGVLAHPPDVGLHDCAVIGRDSQRSIESSDRPPCAQVRTARSFQAAFPEHPIKEAIADAELAHQLTHGLAAGQVSFDEVVDVRNVAFCGHVYDFETTEGYYAANGVIVSNCRCGLTQLSEAQARERGYGTQSPPQVDPDPGWDYDRAEGIAPGVAASARRRQAEGGEMVERASDRVSAYVRAAT